MPSKKQYNLVHNDEYDTRIPLHSEEAFHRGIVFHAKVIWSDLLSSSTYKHTYVYLCFWFLFLVFFTDVTALSALKCIRIYTFQSFICISSTFSNAHILQIKCTNVNIGVLLLSWICMNKFSWNFPRIVKDYYSEIEGKDCFTIDSMSNLTFEFM